MFAGRGVDIPMILDRLKRTADSLGLPFTTRSMTYNSRKAQELSKWAEAEGHGDPFHQQVFEAYFAHGRNIAEEDVLKELSAAASLDPAAVSQILQEGRYKQAVDQDWQYCARLGITAVPTLRLNNRVLVGAQPYEAMLQMVVAEGAAGRVGQEKD